MENLQADEVTLTIHQKDTLSIEARKIVKKLHFSKFGLFNNHTKKPNKLAHFIINLSINLNIPSKESDKKSVSRIRGVFRDYLGIKSDIFFTKEPNRNWKQRFIVIDKRNSSNKREKDRAKQEQYEESIAYEAPDFDDENDPAGIFIKNITRM